MANKEPFKVSVLRAENAHAIPAHRLEMALAKLCELTGGKFILPDATTYMIDQMFTAPTDAEMFKRAHTAAPTIDKLLEET